MRSPQNADDEYVDEPYPGVDHEEYFSSDYNDQSAASKPKRKSCAGRKLMRWDVEKDQHVLLCIEYVVARDGVALDWQAVADLINPDLSGEAIKQHLIKVRKAREAEGQAVPPRLDRNQTRRKKSFAEVPTRAPSSRSRAQPSNDRLQEDHEEENLTVAPSVRPKTNGLLYVKPKPGKKTPGHQRSAKMDVHMSASPINWSKRKIKIEDSEYDMGQPQSKALRNIASPVRGSKSISRRKKDKKVDRSLMTNFPKLSDSLDGDETLLKTSAEVKSEFESESKQDFGVMSKSDEPLNFAANAGKPFYSMKDDERHYAENIQNDVENGGGAAFNMNGSVDGFDPQVQTPHRPIIAPVAYNLREHAWTGVSSVFPGENVIPGSMEEPICRDQMQGLGGQEDPFANFPSEGTQALPPFNINLCDSGGFGRFPEMGLPQRSVQRHQQGLQQEYGVNNQHEYQTGFAQIEQSNLDQTLLAAAPGAFNTMPRVFHTGISGVAHVLPSANHNDSSSMSAAAGTVQASLDNYNGMRHQVDFVCPSEVMLNNYITHNSTHRPEWF